MVLSKYVKTFPLDDYPGYQLVYSTSTSSITLLPDEEFEVLQKGDVLPESKVELEELGIFTNNPDQEQQEVLAHYPKLNELNPNLTIAIVLGMECNFDCLYCYEGTLKGRFVMADQTADQVIAFIKQRYTEKKSKIHLDFYGGEPLLYTDRIKYLAQPLQAFAIEQGGSFDFNLVTNGSLLKVSTVEELKEYGLVYAKVTIDGPAANHDKFRPFKTGKSSFKSIVKNLKEVCGLIDIGLGGNYTKENYKEFPLLLDQLHEEGVGPQQLERVVFNMVMDVQDEFGPREHYGGCTSISEPWMIEASLYIREEVLKRGYFVPELGREVCAIYIDDNITIYYDGSIYKCLPLAGREQFKVGDVQQEIADFSDSHCLDNWQKSKECQVCTYLPICFGGCRLMEYLRSGTMEKVDCLKQYYDKALPELLKQDVKYRYGE